MAFLVVLAVLAVLAVLVGYRFRVLWSHCAVMRTQVRSQKKRSQKSNLISVLVNGVEMIRFMVPHDDTRSAMGCMHRGLSLLLEETGELPFEIPALSPRSVHCSPFTVHRSPASSSRTPRRHSSGGSLRAAAVSPRRRGSPLTSCRRNSTGKLRLKLSSKRKSR